MSAPMRGATQKKENVRQLTPHRLVCVPACAYLASILERHEKAVMPSRVVADVLGEEALDELQLTGPQLRLIKVSKQPLPVAPGVIILGVCFE